MIQANDDAIRAIKLLVAKVADAVLEGKASRKEEDIDDKPAEVARTDKPSRKGPKVVETDVELADDALLGESTLAKMAPKKDVVVETPVVETPVVETHVVEAPVVEAPATDTPAESAPAAEKPE